MICPYCASFTPDGSRFCCRCASRIPEAAAPETPAVTSEDIPTPAAAAEDIPTPAAPVADIPVPVKKKGRLWPPLLILAVLFAAGLGLFLSIGSPSAVRDPAMPWFSVQDGVLYFDGSRYTGGSELTVPAVIAGQTVTSVSDECFYACGGLTAVHLPDGLESIGVRAFSGCTSLRGIWLPDTLTSIGAEAFADCGALEAVCIPHSVTQTGAGIFDGCGRLVHVFYSGPFASLGDLGIEFENPQAWFYCADGSYPQGYFPPAG